MILSRYFLIKGPPTTTDSLLAKATNLPFSNAFKVGFKPTKPIIALTTKSTSLSLTNSVIPSIPDKTFMFNSLSILSAVFTSKTATFLGLNFLI